MNVIASLQNNLLAYNVVHLVKMIFEACATLASMLEHTPSNLSVAVESFSVLAHFNPMHNLIEAGQHVWLNGTSNLFGTYGLLYAEREHVRARE